MSDSANPYQSPDLSSQTPAEREYMRRGRRPKSPRVIAGLSLFFLLWVVGSHVAQWAGAIPQPDPAALALQERLTAAMGYHPAYITFSIVVGWLMMVWLGATAVGLWEYKDWARRSFNGYALLTILWQLGTLLYLVVRLTLIELEGMVLFGFLAALIGLPISLLFPVLGMVFLNKPQVKAALD